MPLVTVAEASERVPVAEAQVALGTLERLDGGLLSDADDERVLGGRQVESDDVGRLGGELGVAAEASAAAPLQVDAVPPQDPPDVVLGDVAELLCE